MLSTSFASLPLLQPLWSCYCMVAAFSFFFLPKGCNNFLLTLTGGTTAAPARGESAETAFLRSSFSSRATQMNLCEAFQHAAFLGAAGCSGGARMIQQGWITHAPHIPGHLLSVLQHGSTPSLGQCPVLFSWSLAASLPRHI